MDKAAHGDKMIATHGGEVPGAPAEPPSAHATQGDPMGASAHISCGSSCICGPQCKCTPDSCTCTGKTKCGTAECPCGESCKGGTAGAAHPDKKAGCCGGKGASTETASGKTHSCPCGDSCKCSPCECPKTETAKKEGCCGGKGASTETASGKTHSCPCGDSCKCSPCECPKTETAGAGTAKKEGCCGDKGCGGGKSVGKAECCASGDCPCVPSAHASHGDTKMPKELGGGSMKTCEDCDCAAPSSVAHHGDPKHQ